MLISALRCSLRTHLRNRPQGWGRRYLARRRCSFVVWERTPSSHLLTASSWTSREGHYHEKLGGSHQDPTDRRDRPDHHLSAHHFHHHDLAITYLNFQPTAHLLHLLPPTKGSDERQGGEEGTFRRKPSRGERETPWTTRGPRETATAGRWIP